MSEEFGLIEKAEKAIQGICEAENAFVFTLELIESINSAAEMKELSIAIGVVSATSKLESMEDIMRKMKSSSLESALMRSTVEAHEEKIEELEALIVSLEAKEKE